MMGGKKPETCWAVNKRQDNKLKNCCIRVCDLFELNVKLRCQKVNSVPARSKQWHTTTPSFYTKFLGLIVLHSCWKKECKVLHYVHAILLILVKINFRRFRKNCQKGLLASSCTSVCPSVHPSAWNNSAPIELFLLLLLNVIFAYFSKIC